MHRYLRRGGMDVQPAPWQCNDVRAQVFYLRGDFQKLQDLCDRCLNLSNAPRYSPVLEYVALTFQRFEGLFSDCEPHTTQPGRHHYTEASLWVMISNGADTRVFIPYMFVDNWVALAAGREVYGFPKEYATIQMPSPGNGNNASVSALALQHAGPGPVRELSMMKCAPTAGHLLTGASNIAKGALANFWQSLGPDSLLTALFPPIGPIAQFLAMLGAGRLPIAFLRQIRATQGGNDADLLQVVNAEVRPFNVSIPTILPPHELRLAALASHPIAADLGLQAKANGAFDVTFAIEVDIDNFRLQPGVVAWP